VVVAELVAAEVVFAELVLERLVGLGLAALVEPAAEAPEALRAARLGLRVVLGGLGLVVAEPSAEASEVVCPLPGWLGLRLVLGRLGLGLRLRLGFGLVAQASAEAPEVVAARGLWLVAPVVER